MCPNFSHWCNTIPSTVFTVINQQLSDNLHSIILPCMLKILYIVSSCLPSKHRSVYLHHILDLKITQRAEQQLTLDNKKDQITATIVYPLFISTPQKESLPLQSGVFRVEAFLLLPLLLWDVSVGLLDFDTVTVPVVTVTVVRCTFFVNPVLLVAVTLE